MCVNVDVCIYVIRRMRGCTMYIVHCVYACVLMLMSVYMSLDVCVDVQCTLYNEQCTYACVYLCHVGVQCTLYNVHCVLFIGHGLEYLFI